MRWSVLALLALGACSEGASEAPKPTEAVASAEKIECALGPGMGFVRDCTVERSLEGGVHKLVVRHSDGGFRRFEVNAENTIVAADGAEPAQVAVSGTIAQVSVGEDRYRIPLEAKPDVTKP